jgi:hypothetical protein
MEEPTGWPIDRTPEETLRHIIRNCARPAGRSRIGARPRWSIVSDLTTNGSGYSSRLCVWAGVDPNEIVVRRK